MKDANFLYIATISMLITWYLFIVEHNLITQL